MKRAAAEVELHSRRAKQPRGVSSKVLGRRVEVLSDYVKWFAGTVREYGTWRRWTCTSPSTTTATRGSTRSLRRLLPVSFGGCDRMLLTGSLFGILCTF